MSMSESQHNIAIPDSFLSTNLHQPLINNSHGQQLFELNEDTVLSKLLRLHVAAAVFFFIQSLSYLSAINHPKPIEVEPTTGFSSPSDGPIGDADLQYYDTFNPLWLVVAFVVLAFFDHGLTALVAWRRPQLAKTYLFQHKNNPLRWAEYSISASTMVVAVAILCGVHDMHMWFILGLLNSVGILMGQLLEQLPRASMRHRVKSDANARLVYGVGCLACLGPWVVILCYFLDMSRNAVEEMPQFVYAAMVGTFIMFFTFAVNSFLHHIVGLYDFHTAELIYIILSFTAKTFLAADVFGGVRATT